MREYKLVREESFNFNDLSQKSLERKVSKMMNEGWELHGSPTYYRHTYLEKDGMVQAMVRET